MNSLVPCRSQAYLIAFSQFILLHPAVDTEDVKALQERIPTRPHVGPVAGMGCLILGGLVTLRQLCLRFSNCEATIRSVPRSVPNRKKPRFLLQVPKNLPWHASPSVTAGLRSSVVTVPDSGPKVQNRYDL